MTRGSLQYVSGLQLADAAFPPDGWWLDFPGMGRYFSTPTNNPKNMKPWEVDRAADLDHGLMCFAEQGETTPINSTLDDDIRLAEQTVRMATDFEVPPGAPMMFAVDTDGRAYMDQIRAAFVTYRQRVPAWWPLWAYAGSDVIDQLIDDGTITGGHIPAALSWSSTRRPVDGVEVFQTSGGLRWYRSPSALMIQHPSESYRGGRIDRNDIIPGKAVPLWYPGRPQLGPGPVPPSPRLEIPTMASHITFARKATPNPTTGAGEIEIVARQSDGQHRYRWVSDIPGGAGTFYVIHPGAVGVNPIGDAECDAMGYYDAADDLRTMAAGLRSGGGSGGVGVGLVGIDIQQVPGRAAAVYG